MSESDLRLERIERKLDGLSTDVTNLKASWGSVATFIETLRCEHPQCQARLGVLERVMWAVVPLGLGGGGFGLFKFFQP